MLQDHEVNLTSTNFQHLDAYRQENGPSLIAEVLSSSFDDQFPSTSILTNDQYTFWMSSGMFPQFLRLVLREPMPIALVEITCRHVKKLLIRSSRSRQSLALLGGQDLGGKTNRNSADSVELEVPSGEANKQTTHRIALGSMGERDAEVIEVAIESGYSEFVCVYFVRLCLADPPTATASSGGDADDEAA